MLDTEFIARRRIELKLTQEQAAVAAGIGNRHIWNRLERGNRPNARPDTLLRIAKALQCSMEDLMVMPKAAKKRRRA